MDRYEKIDYLKAISNIMRSVRHVLENRYPTEETRDILTGIEHEFLNRVTCGSSQTKDFCSLAANLAYTIVTAVTYGSNEEAA